MSISSNSSRGLGNTNQTPKRQPSPAKRWCLTLNNYSEKEYQELISSISSENYIIGKETGEEGTPHLQGYIEFKEKKRLTALKKINNRIHWEAAKGNKDSNIEYCSKDNNYVTNFKVKKPLKILDDNLLYDWEKDIIKIINEEPHDRRIYWIYDPIGNKGKTTFAKYLAYKHGAIPLEGKKNDILYCAAEYESNIYVYDLERTMEDYVPYGAIEKIKNGFYMCGKYEGKPIIRNPPHLFIFSNFLPEDGKLSQDRIVIFSI